MAQFTITVPDPLVERVLDAFAGLYGWQPMVEAGGDRENPPAMVPNPVSQTVFVKRQLRHYVRSVVIGYEAKMAGDMAKQYARNRAETDMLGVVEV